jgi:hypothetical protein
VLRKRRLSALLGQWLELAGQRRSARLRLERAVRHFAARQYAAAWHGWLAFHEVGGLLERGGLACGSCC